MEYARLDLSFEQTPSGPEWAMYTHVTMALITSKWARLGYGHTCNNGVTTKWARMGYVPEWAMEYAVGPNGLCSKQWVLGPIGLWSTQCCDRSQTGVAYT